MDEKPFKEKSEKPKEDKITEVLGDSFLFYKEFNELTNTFKKEWNYSKSSGWLQKVSDRKKALYYFIPLMNSFRVSMAIWEQEKFNFIADPKYNVLLNQLNSAKKYSEGFALQFLIKDKASFTPLKTLINGLIE
jgi:hypothetical protein